MNIPFSVCQFLYKGISSEISFLKMKIEDDSLSNYDKRKFSDLKEALEWYKENCVISSVHLEKEFAALEQMRINYKNNE
jgi:hypothetical protein